MHQPDSNAVKLNNKAVKLLGQINPYNDSLNNILYDSAQIYLDQAIEVDSLYLLAYTNKSQVLRGKSLLEESLEVLNKALTIRPDFAEIMTVQGFLLEKMGNLKLAGGKYAQALEAYEKRLNNNPESTKTKSDIAFLYLFLEDKNKAIDEIQSLVIENPNNDELKSMERYIENFDRKKFIEEY